MAYMFTQRVEIATPRGRKYTPYLHMLRGKKVAECVNAALAMASRRSMKTSAALVYSLTFV